MKTNSSRLHLSPTVPRWWARLEKLLAVFYQLYEREPSGTIATLPETAQLRRSQVMRLKCTSQIRQVHVRQGAIWLTRTPADGDIIVQAGEKLNLDHGWPVVVQALQDSRVDWWH